MAGPYISRALCSVFALCALTGTAQAQGAEESRTLDTISVTATRNPIESFEYPGMVTVIGREEILSRQASTPDDILKLVPNVEFTGGPRRTGESPSIRGFSGPDVVIMFDGARQNFDGAHDGRFFLDPSLLRKVEVLRGPASSLYGSGGTGGVIEFRTIDAADFLTGDQKWGASVSGGWQGVNREFAETVTGYGKPAEGWDIVGSVTKRDSGSIATGNDGEVDETDDDIIAGLAKASYAFGGHHRLEGAVIGFRNDAQEPNNAQAAGSGGVVNKDIEATTLRTSYSYRNPNNNLVDLDVVAYYADFKDDELRLDSNGSGPAGELLKRDVDTFGMRVDNRSRFVSSGNVATTFTYGGEFYTDKQDGAAGADEADGVPDADDLFAGAFVQAEVAIAEPFGSLPGDLLIIPGLRYDYYEASSSIANDNDSSEWSPRIGLSYLPNDWLMGFVNYAHAFRAPTFNELYQEGTHFTINTGAGVTNRFVTNANLTPQTTRTFEFGGGLTFDDVAQEADRMQFKASYFRIWGDDFIDVDVDQPALFTACNPFIPGNCDGTTTTVNVPKAELWGKEIEGSYENARFLVSLGFSFIDGENEDTGEKLGVLTPAQVTANTGLKLPEIDSIVGWRAIASDKFEKVNESDDVRDGYTTHDFYFSWQPSQQELSGLRVDLGIDNAFDKAYSRVYTGVNEAGRNYKALVSYTQNW